MDKTDKLEQVEKIKINSLNFTKDLFTITDTEGKTYTSQVIKGSVSFRVYNQEDQEVPISNIEEGDVIKIKILNDKTRDKTQQKNNIIKKIIIKNKYVFNSESSDDLESDDENLFSNK